jgi:hypothetical protein
MSARRGPVRGIAPRRRRIVGGVFVAPTLTQDGFRFYEDDAVEGSATPLAGEDIDITVAKATPFRLRLQVDTTGDAPSGQFKLQYRKVGDPASEWEDVL